VSATGARTSAAPRILGPSTGAWLRRLTLVLVALPAILDAQTPLVRFVSNTDPVCGGRSPCYATIQAGVTAAHAGDVVRILPGTYVEQVSITGKNNTAGASEASRIVVETDPGAPAASVVLQGVVTQCTSGYAVRFEQSKFVTLRGLTITGAGGQAVSLLGGTNENEAIHLERLRLVGNGSGACNGGITIARGNPDTLIANSFIYGNGRNGIAFLGADGGPHAVISNTIVGNGWNGVAVARKHDVLLVNNVITGNGTATGWTGGRAGITRKGSTASDPAGIQLRHNLICGNRLGEIRGPALDASDVGNLTPTGSEGPGVSARAGCEVPDTLYAALAGPDGVLNTLDDDPTPAPGSPSIDTGEDPRMLGLNPAFGPLLEADLFGPARRPRAGSAGGPSAFDRGAAEIQGGGDTEPPAVSLVQPAANAYLRQTVTVEAQATDLGDDVAALALSAGGAPLDATLTPAPPAPAVTATAAWNTTTTPDGAHTVSATATDGAGQSAMATRIVFVDNTPPATTVTSGPSGSIGGITATFTFTGTDNLSAPANLQFAWRLDGGMFSAFSSATAATVTGLAVGPHTFEVTARDQAGNEDPTPAAQSFTVMAGPVITALVPATGQIGTLVAIQGQNFATTPGGNQVRFNGVAAVVRGATATTITATVPPGAATGPVTVTTAQGVALSPTPFTVTTPQDFALQVAPAVASVLPGALTAYTVTLPSTGSEPFTGLATLSVQGLPAGVTATLEPAKLTGGQRGTVTVTAAPGAVPDTASVTFQAMAAGPSGAVTRTAAAQLTVGAPGQTALVGRLVVVDGRPIVGARLTLGGQTASSDAAGNFALTGVPEGVQTLSLDTRPFDPGFPVYGIDVALTAGQVTTLGPLVITPPPPPERFTPIANATQDQVVTDPRYPGLSLMLPAGVTITGWDGQPKTRVAFERLSPERLPVPLPHFTPRSLYQVYFGTPMGGLPSAPLPISLPNDGGLEPGQQTDIWYYDAAPFPGASAGWRRAGSATVSEDGTRVVSDPGVGLERFCGVCGVACFPPDLPPRNPDGPQDGDPVDLALGQQILEKTDLALPGQIPAVVHRTYNPFEPFGGIAGFELGLGPGWALSVEVVLLELVTGSGVPMPIRRLILPGNAKFDFQRQADGTYAHATHPRFAGAVLTPEAEGAHRLRFKDGRVWRFVGGWLGRAGNLAGLGLLVEEVDRNGNRLAIERDGFGTPTRIVEPAGRALALTQANIGPGGRITAAEDPLGRRVTYSYEVNPPFRLAAVTDPEGGVTRYTYDVAGRILTITDPRGITYLRHDYDARGRIVRQTQVDEGTWTFAYEGPVGAHTRVTVTNPRGFSTTYELDNRGFLTAVRDALGQTTRYERDGRGQILAVTDPLNRVKRYEYDPAGNVTSATRLAGTPNAVTTSYTYEPTFSQVTSVTDPLNHTTSFGYDAQGRLTSVTDPLNHQIAVTMNAAGQVTAVTDPLTQTTSFGYDAGDLATISDPLGNRTTRVFDPTGRLLSVTDPLGRHTTYQYDSLHRLTRGTDPLSGETTFTYDPNGNLLSVTDAKGNTTSYTYNTMDRLATRVDPLGRSETYQYDGTGNLTQVTDRKNQVTTFTYDALNRRTQATYQDGSTTTYIYDAGNRLTQIVDSLAGTITRTYDGLDRLTQETTPQGRVSYTYDAAGRRTSMTVAGQPSVTYTYDTADRLTQLAQGTSTVTIGYDHAHRRTSLALPNGILIESAYDPASRLTGLTYTLGPSVLGTLTYGYDAAGNRIGVGGTWARATLPAPVDPASYNANNQQLALGAQTMSYDLNGNLGSQTDGSGMITYTWNARNQLTGLAGPGLTASFGYDGLRRRWTKTINGAQTDFLYDGLNPVQEGLLPSTPAADHLTGLGLDEVVTRTDVAGARHFLPDALGSTLALSDPAGAVATEYTYEPFGATTAAGASSANAFQYTGRENDGTGLYYYRARYYHPGLGRFIAEDPIEFLGADPNLYLYVGNQPTVLTDPSGLIPLAPIAIGAGIGAINGAITAAVSNQSVIRGAAIGAATGALGPLAGAGPIMSGAIAAVGNVAGQVLNGTGSISATGAIGAGLGGMIPGSAGGFLSRPPIGIPRAVGGPTVGIVLGPLGGIARGFAGRGFPMNIPISVPSPPTDICWLPYPPEPCSIPGPSKSTQ
jgi:RHS repeat-associated protein